MTNDLTIVHPDPKGRISLGKFIPAGTTSFRAWTDKNGQIILEPCVDIPVREILALRIKNNDEK